jgi:hypothetical protein
LLLFSLKEYEERAVFLATNPSKLQTLTNRLKAVRMTCPLFDTARWVTLQSCFCSIPYLFRVGNFTFVKKFAGKESGQGIFENVGPALLW